MFLVTLSAGGLGWQATAQAAGQEQAARSGKTNGDAHTTVLMATGSLSGLVYADADANGSWSPGEPGISGVSIALTGTDTNGARWRHDEGARTTAAAWRRSPRRSARAPG